MAKIKIPHNFEPRSYQLPLLQAMDSGYKRAVCVWHRRAGKDLTLINLMTKKAFERVGCYYYYFPTGTKGRQTIWDGINKDGFPFIEYIPKEVIEKKNDQEMKIQFVNGSIFQVIGTDRTEVVGPNPVGCIFSEYALQNPKAWQYVQPILAENEGWAVFNSTPRGMNHLYQLYQSATGLDDWFTQVLTVDDTNAISREAIQAAKAAGMSEELARQEFWCDWQYGLEGAYYLNQLAAARREGRICDIPVMAKPVNTAWDLGVGDSTAIWFWQVDGLYFNVIDYYENSGESLDHYISVLKSKNYNYGDHFVPHDADKRGAFDAKSYVQRAREELGIKFIVLRRDPSIDSGIEAARAIFPQCRFDQTRCQDGLNALMNYQKILNEKQSIEGRPSFADRPLHNWASHGADAFRYFARAARENKPAEIDIDVRDWYVPPVEPGLGWMG